MERQTTGAQSGLDIRQNVRFNGNRPSGGTAASGMFARVAPMKWQRKDGAGRLYGSQSVKASAARSYSSCRT